MKLVKLLSVASFDGFFLWHLATVNYIVLLLITLFVGQNTISFCIHC